MSEGMEKKISEVEVSLRAFLVLLDDSIVIQLDHTGRQELVGIETDEDAGLNYKEFFKNI